VADQVVAVALLAAGDAGHAEALKSVG